MKKEDVVQLQQPVVQSAAISPGLEGYIEQYMTKKWKEKDIATYAVVSEFYDRFKEALKNCKPRFLQQQRNSV